MISGKYEPVYFSKLHAWKNDINHSDERYSKLVKDLEFFEVMFSQFLDLLRSRNIDEMAIRQGVLIWLNGGASIDYELYDFDKKVANDVKANLQENTGMQLG